MLRRNEKKNREKMFEAAICLGGNHQGA